MAATKNERAYTMDRETRGNARRPYQLTGEQAGHSPRRECPTIPSTPGYTVAMPTEPVRRPRYKAPMTNLRIRIQRRWVHWLNRRTARAYDHLVDLEADS